MKTYVLTVSLTFPKTHKRAGDYTFFSEKILLAIGKIEEAKFIEEFGELLFKLHTIRANYELWAKRIKEIQEGKAILSIRYWSGKPYHSKQVEICRQDKDSGIGIQELVFSSESNPLPFSDVGIHSENAVVWKAFDFNECKIYQNDGLSLEDFKDWFRKYDLSKSMAIIHFTSFRY